MQTFSFWMAWTSFFFTQLYFRDYSLQMCYESSCVGATASFRKNSNLTAGRLHPNRQVCKLYWMITYAPVPEFHLGQPKTSSMAYWISHGTERGYMTYFLIWVNLSPSVIYKLSLVLSYNGRTWHKCYLEMWQLSTDML